MLKNSGSPLLKKWVPNWCFFKRSFDTFWIPSSLFIWNSNNSDISSAVCELSILSSGNNSFDFKKASQAPITKYSAAISISFLITSSKNSKYCSANLSIDNLVKSILWSLARLKSKSIGPSNPSKVKLNTSILGIINSDTFHSFIYL